MPYMWFLCFCWKSVFFWLLNIVYRILHIQNIMWTVLYAEERERHTMIHLCGMLTNVKKSTWLGERLLLNGCEIKPGSLEMFALPNNVLCVICQDKITHTNSEKRALHMFSMSSGWGPIKHRTWRRSAGERSMMTSGGMIYWWVKQNCQSKAAVSQGIEATHQKSIPGSELSNQTIILNHDTFSYIQDMVCLCVCVCTHVCLFICMYVYLDI